MDLSVAANFHRNRRQGREKKGGGMRGDDQMNSCGNRDGGSGRMRKLGRTEERADRGVNRAE